MDSGACSTAISASVYRRVLRLRDTELKEEDLSTGANDAELEMLGSTWLSLFVNHFTLEVRIQYLSRPVLLGQDIMSLAVNDSPCQH